MKALVVALNPSIDAEWQVREVLWEEKNNVRAERRWAGGKGINVARWLKQLGAKPRILLPLGGSAGRELAGYLRQEKLSARIIPLAEPTRVNVIVTTENRRQLRFNPLGPEVKASHWRQILSAFRSELQQAKIVVLSGSLPRGVKVSAYAELLRIAHGLGKKVLLDCDGAALQAAIGSKPFLIKPNDHELSLWCGKPLNSERAIVRAARELSQRSGGWVFVSRGEKRGILINAEQGQQFMAAPQKSEPRNTVGAGDALLAAVTREILAGSKPPEWLQRGLAVGTAATQLPAGCVGK